MATTVFLADVQDFQPLPAGVYTVEVTGVEQRESQSGPDPYLNWELTVLDHPEYSGRKLWTITSLGQKSAWKLRETLLAFGETAETLGDPNGFELVETDYIGIECQASVIQESYQGRMTNRVTGLQPAKAAAPQAPVAPQTGRTPAGRQPAPAPGTRRGGVSVK